MQASMPANVEALPSAQAAPVIDYSRTVDELLELYARIDLAAVALPFAVYSKSRRWPLTMARAGEVIAGIAIRDDRLRRDLFSMGGFYRLLDRSRCSGVACFQTQFCLRLRGSSWPPSYCPSFTAFRF
jgi:hypothetical protein